MNQRLYIFLYSQNNSAMMSMLYVSDKKKEDAAVSVGLASSRDVTYPQKKKGFYLVLTMALQYFGNWRCSSRLTIQSLLPKSIW
jgi:hypothetical protein